MNEFVSTKVGEVLAFARLCTDTLEMGRSALAEMVGEERLDSAEDELETLERSIAALAQDEHAVVAIETSATQTQEKLRTMRDTYIDGNWDEASEVLEWLGFSTGAALVHWHLLAGAARATDDSGLADVAKDAIRFYTSLFSSDEAVLAEIGASAAA